MTRLTYSLLFILLFSATLVFGQALQTTKVDSSAAVTLRIDPESARGAAVSQIFEEVEFIPLETTAESTFGRISQLKITDNHFIIYDMDTRAVLIFLKTGKFITKINASSIKNEDNSQEQMVIRGFHIVGGDGQEQIRIYAGKNIACFDLDGKLIQKIPANGYTNLPIFKFLDTNYRIKPNHLDVIGKDSIRHEISIFNKKIASANYLRSIPNRFSKDLIMPSSNVNLSGLYYSNIRDKYFYNRGYNLNIYEITPKKLSLAYQIILPANSAIPFDFNSNEIYSGQKLNFLQKNPLLVYGVGDLFKFGNNLFFKLKSLSTGRGKKHSMIYNLSTNELISINNLEPDSLSFYLPVTDAGVYSDYNIYGMLSNEKGYLYTSYSSLAMFTFKEQSVGKNPQYNIALTEYFKTQNKKSNPVLIKLKPKVVN